MPANHPQGRCWKWSLCVFAPSGSPVQFVRNAIQKRAPEVCAALSGSGNQLFPIFALSNIFMEVMRTWEIQALSESLGGIDGGHGPTMQEIFCRFQLFNPCMHSAFHSISLHSLPRSAALFRSQAPCCHACFFVQKSGLGNRQDMPQATQVPYEAHVEDAELHHWCAFWVPKMWHAHCDVPCSQ